MSDLLHIPSIRVWWGRPLSNWKHGERFNPSTWPWWIPCRFKRVTIEPNINLRHKKITEIGFCEEARCNPKKVPNHYEDITPRVYSRFYLYTRKLAYSIDIRIAKE